MEERKTINAPMAAVVPKTTTGSIPPAMPRAEKMPLMPQMKTEKKAEVSMSAVMTKQEQMMEVGESGPCGYKTGDLPQCAPLAAGYVPYQRMNSPKYTTADALTHGTLFPGLDLPFMNSVNKNNPYAGTPLGEVMAIGFAIHELNLYLDTHKDDKEAFEMQKKLLVLDRECRKEYERLYGPISMYDLEDAERYTWLRDPWPWEYAERTGK